MKRDEDRTVSILLLLMQTSYAYNLINKLFSYVKFRSIDLPKASHEYSNIL